MNDKITNIINIKKKGNKDNPKGQLHQHNPILSEAEHTENTEDNLSCMDVDKVDLVKSQVEHVQANEFKAIIGNSFDLKSISLNNAAFLHTENHFNFDICELSWDALSKLNAFPVTVK